MASFGVVHGRCQVPRAQRSGVRAVAFAPQRVSVAPSYQQSAQRVAQGSTAWLSGKLLPTNTEFLTTRHSILRWKFFTFLNLSDFLHQSCSWLEHHGCNARLPVKILNSCYKPCLACDSFIIGSATWQSTFFSYTWKCQSVDVCTVRIITTYFKLATHKPTRNWHDWSSHFRIGYPNTNLFTLCKVESLHSFDWALNSWLDPYLKDYFWSPTWIMIKQPCYGSQTECYIKLYGRLSSPSSTCTFPVPPNNLWPSFWLSSRC